MERLLSSEESRLGKEHLREDEQRTYDRIRAQVTKALSARISGKYQTAAEYLLLLPDFAVLILRLARDPRVPLAPKAKLALFAVYLVSPLDIIPDFIPVVGQLDDLFGAVYVLDSVFRSVPREAVMDNWSGDDNVIEVVGKVLAAIRELWGDATFRRIFGRRRGKEGNR